MHKDILFESIFPIYSTFHSIIVAFNKIEMRYNFEILYIIQCARIISFLKLEPKFELILRYLKSVKVYNL